MCGKIQSCLTLQYVVLITTTGFQKLERLGWLGIHCPQRIGTSNATTGPPPEPGESCPPFFVCVCGASTRFQVMTSPWRDFAITPRHTIIGRTPLDKWSARRRGLYLTTHNTHKIQKSMPPAGFEPAIPASERPQTHVLEHAATGIGAHTYRPYFAGPIYSPIYAYLPLSISSVVFLRPSFCICSLTVTCSVHPKRPDFMALVIHYKEWNYEVSPYAVFSSVLLIPLCYFRIFVSHYHFLKLNHSYVSPLRRDKISIQYKKVFSYILYVLILPSKTRCLRKYRRKEVMRRRGRWGRRRKQLLGDLKEKRV
jgi:hypothetical protein